MPNRPIRKLIANQQIHTVEKSISVRTAAHIMATARVGSVMVVDKDVLVGIFTERDALFRVLAGGLDPDRTKVGEVMTANPQTITPDRPLINALHLMHDGGFRHMPVVENGRPVGMVSIRDAMAIDLLRLETDQNRKEAIAEILA